MSIAPILLIVFNRPNQTRQVLTELKKVKPNKLYVSMDGARKSRPEDVEKVNQVRSLILDSVDWDCDLEIKSNDQNLGCKIAVSQAIHWFFENEEEGIILEDDCLPQYIFFEFCSRMLLEYKDDLMVGGVSGYFPFGAADNLTNGFQSSDLLHCFSKYWLVWGWATWRDRWEKYTLDASILEELEESPSWMNSFDKREKEYWIEIFELCIQNKIDTWDYQWMLQFFKNGWSCVLPTKSLIHNIGFGVDATHTFTGRIQEAEHVAFNGDIRLVSKSRIFELDKFIFRKHFGGAKRYYPMRILWLIKRALSI